MRKSTKLSLTILLLVCLFGNWNLKLVNAYSYIEGSKLSATVMGQKYNYYSSILLYDIELRASVTVATDDKSNKPIGYMGMLARLYTSSGALRTSSDWRYSDVPCYSASQYTNYVRDKGTYYSKGQVKMYNGNGYNTYTSNSSPNAQLRSLKKQDFSVNKNGLTYGSDYYSTCALNSPDLILAEGKNGIEGYVKYSDLNKYQNINTLEDAIKYQNNIESEREIPVYDENGENIIDCFIIDNKDCVFFK